jgi:hypothetical protein
VAFLGAVLLVLVIYIRPQEFIPALATVGLLNIATGVAAIGIAVEIGMGKIKNLNSPQLPWVIAFLAWCYVTVIIRAGFRELDATNRTIWFSFLFMLIIMFACRSLERLSRMMALLLALGLFLAGVGIMQGHHNFECVKLTAEDVLKDERTSGEPTGRPCVLSRLECDAEDRAMAVDYSPEEFEYVCEKAGPFETFTVAHGRVRWRGILADPNELAMTLGATLALAFAFYGNSRRKIRVLLLGLTIVAIGYCVILTQSRSGVLVIATVLGVYFVRRYGITRGVVVGALMTGPLLVLGGRSGEEADSSSDERAGALFRGVDLVLQYPFLGVGRGLFGDYYFITAHNSYLLTAAELGIPGMLIWSIVLYVTAKVPFTLAFRTPEGTDPALREFAIALFVSLCAFFVGVAFLSFAYHNLLWIYIGLSGALYGVAREKLPGFRVGFSKKEAAYIGGADIGILLFLLVYSRLRPGD